MAENGLKTPVFGTDKADGRRNSRDGASKKAFNVQNCKDMKITKLVSRPMAMGIGDGMEMGDAFAPNRKLWVQAAIAAAGLAASLYGQASSAAAANKAEARQRRLEQEQQSWYKRRYNEDYIDTAAGQNLVRRAKQFAQENWRKAQGAQAVTGGTEAATAQAKEAGNRMVGDTIANIAGTDTQRKDNADNIRLQQMNQNAQMDIQRENQRSQNIAQAGAQAANSVGSIVSAFDQGNNNKVSLGGSSNGGVATDASGSMAAMRMAAADDLARIRMRNGG